MYTPPNQQAILSCEEIEAADMQRRQSPVDYTASGQTGEWASYKWEEDGALTPLATLGPYKTNTMNRKLTQAKEWLASREKQA